MEDQLRGKDLHIAKLENDIKEQLRQCNQYEDNAKIVTENMDKLRSEFMKSGPLRQNQTADPQLASQSNNSMVDDTDYKILELENK